LLYDGAELVNPAIPTGNSAFYLQVLPGIVYQWDTLGYFDVTETTAGSDSLIVVDLKNVVGSTEYAKQGYTSSLDPLLFTDGRQPLCKVEFDIVNDSTFALADAGLAWDEYDANTGHFDSSMSRKKSDEDCELISSIATVNAQPIAADVSGSGTEGETITTVLSATDVDSSDPADVTFSIVDAPAYETGGVTIGPVGYAGGVFTATATYTHDGSDNLSDTFTYKATDKHLTDSNVATATITVTGVNDAPEVSDIPDQSIAEGSTFATISLDDYVSDPDNADDEMTWAYSGNTELTVSIVDRVATISIPGVEWNGSETITFTATDPGLLDDSDTASFTVTAVNDAPVVTDIPDQSIAEGSTFATISLDDYVSDVDNADSEMTWTYSGNSELTVSIVGRVATISIPDVDWSGSETITFTATDPGLLSDSDAGTFTVTAVNDAPVVTDIPDQSIAEGSTFATISLDDYVSDVDNADDEMTWTYSGNSELTVSIVGRVATISIPDVDWNGSETITFTATDPGLLSDSDAAAFTVTAVNDAPTVSGMSATNTYEGVATSLSATIGDVEDSTLDVTVDWGDGTAVESFFDQPVGSFTKTHVYADDDTYTVTITVADDEPLYGEGTLSVTVDNVDPASLALAPLTATEDAAYSGTLSATDVAADRTTTPAIRR
ncbi:MAG: Ig-like domain-containing protein, partial [bacterium]